MIPGLGGMASALKDVDLDKSNEIKNTRAMVNSMTKKEEKIQTCLMAQDPRE